MNSLPNTSDLTPQALSGILVCDALTARDGTGSNQELIADDFGQQLRGSK